MLRMLNNASITLVASVLLFSIVGHCEMSIYPGLRRKPLQQLQPPYEIYTDFLAQLMEGNARRRLQQQFEQQLELINLQIQRQRERQERLRERYRQQQKLEAMAAAAAAAAENRRHVQDMEETYLRNYNNEYNDNNNNNNNNLLLSNDNISYGNEKYNDGNGDDDDDDEDEKKEDDEEYDNMNPDFSYRIPQPDKAQLNNRIQFAVGPSDPRFYEPDPEEDDADNDDDQLEDDRNSRLQNTDNSNKASEIANADIDANVLDEYEEYKAGDVVVKGASDTLIPNAPLPLTGEQTSVAANFHRIKPQKATNVAAAAAAGLGVNQLNNGALLAQHDLNTLIDTLHQNLVQTANNNNNNNKDELNLVVKEPIGIKTEMGMYMVALVAGITAAVIVGLFIVAIAWYTFHRRNKAAADVDYPAYGITGPNKDISPSGDRKLAQSAQMYHYQHQKQQIMALENRSNVEENGDAVESDDDNEEGDYTVYECPGLAPTAEMEVKNPLFLDETPVTSLGSQAITQVTTQQPPVKKFINKSSTVNNNASVSSSEQKKSKKSKK